MIDTLTQFRDALQSVYGPIDWLPEPDGDIHRFRVSDDKPGTLNGWYVLYLDGIPSGAFGSWKAGGTNTWSSREPANPRESEQVRQRVDLARQQREAERHQRQQGAAEKASRWWRHSRRADPEHPYLVAKGVHGQGLGLRDGELLVPLYESGRLVNLQRIRPDGTKRFLYGGKITGCYSPLGAITPDRPLCICEGWATAATLHQDGGYTVAAALNAGNLLPVAEALRARYPNQEIIIAGDDDRRTPRNPGRTFATAAAIAVGAQVSFPSWPEGSPLDLSDFNDLMRWKGKHGN